MPETLVALTCAVCGNTFQRITAEANRNQRLGRPNYCSRSCSGKGNYRNIPPETKTRTFEQAFKNIDDVLWKEAGCTTELDYTEQTSWLLFLKYLDALEEDKATEAALGRKKYNFILDAPYRWES